MKFDQVLKENSIAAVGMNDVQGLQVGFKQKPIKRFSLKKTNIVKKINIKNKKKAVH